MTAVTLRFVTADDLVSRAIRAGEYGYWATHVEALMPDGTYLGAHYSGGVQARPRTYDAATFTRQAFVPLPCDPAQAVRFTNFLEAQLGKPYDLEAIAALVAGRDWRRADAWFCSELQAAALEQAGIIRPIAAEVAKITPRDLLMIVSALVPVALPAA